MRLFWAVNLPPEVRAEVSGFQTRLKKIRADAKWVEQENLHLTVKFLGETPPEAVSDMIRAVQACLSAVPAFDLAFRGCGTFGRPPRVLWVGVQGAVERFAAVAREVEQALVPFGFKAEGRKVVPHLTVARLRSPAGAGELAEKARLLAAEGGGFGRMRVERVDLMRSTLSRSGPQYDILGSVLLHSDH